MTTSRRRKNLDFGDGKEIHMSSKYQNDNGYNLDVDFEINLLTLRV